MSAHVASCGGSLQLMCPDIKNNTWVSAPHANTAVQNTLVQWSRSSAVVRGISCPSDERKQARIERGRRRELEAGSFGDKRKSTWKSVTVADQPSVSAQLGDMADEYDDHAKRRRKQAWNSLSQESALATTLLTHSPAATTTTASMNKAPSVTSKIGHQKIQVWITREHPADGSRETTDYTKVATLKKMHVCHFASHEDMCVYSVSETS